MSLPANLVWGRHRQETAENVISRANHSQMLAGLPAERMSYPGPFLKPNEGKRWASVLGWQGGRGPACWDSAACPSRSTEPRGPRRARGDAARGRSGLRRQRQAAQLLLAEAQPCENHRRDTQDERANRPPPGQTGRRRPWHGEAAPVGATRPAARGP